MRTKRKQSIPTVPGAKVPYSISGCPVVWHRVDDEAREEGMTFSVYGAKAVEEYKPLKDRCKKYAKELEEEKKKTSLLNSQLTAEKSMRHRESTESKGALEASATKAVQLQKKVDDLTKQLAERDVQLASEKTLRSKEAGESKNRLDSCATSDAQMKKLIEDLRKKLVEKDALLAIFQDERLLRLFEDVKGQSQEVETWDGKIYQITYRHPIDVAKTIIYSFKAKL